jgi:hypothetical protein
LEVFDLALLGVALEILNCLHFSSRKYIYKKININRLLVAFVYFD